MSFIGVLLLAMFLWFMYNFLVKFVLPIYRTTRKLRQQFKNMSENTPSGNQQAPQPPKEKPAAKVGEYIEFEEVK
ncbi:hypothetical protein GCM10027051_03030 [Niabella terrae]